MNSVIHSEKPVADTSKGPTKRIAASAGGKTILVGEHAVVYGARAIAIPIRNLRLNLHIEQEGENAGQTSIDVEIAQRKAPSKVYQVVRQALDILNVQPNRLKIRGDSELPIGAGMGSSAGLCVALLRALCEANQIACSPYELAEWANHLEKNFHGNPSGLDTAVMSLEKPLLYRRGEGSQEIEIRPLQHGHSWPLALIDSGMRASTAHMIKLAEPYFCEPEQGSRRVAQFDSLTARTRDALIHSDIDEVARCMNQAHQWLTDAGVVPDSLTTIVQQIRDLNVLAAKSTGAGGGGMILCLLDPKMSSNQFSQLIKTFGSDRVYGVDL